MIGRLLCALGLHDFGPWTPFYRGHTERIGGPLYDYRNCRRDTCTAPVPTQTRDHRV